MQVSRVSAFREAATRDKEELAHAVAVSEFDNKQVRKTAGKRAKAMRDLTAVCFKRLQN